jgi:hypothetical protein
VSRLPCTHKCVLEKRLAKALTFFGLVELVHAIDEEARRFYLHFNFEPSPVDPMHLMLPIKDLRVMLNPYHELDMGAGSVHYE